MKTWQAAAALLVVFALIISLKENEPVVHVSVPDNRPIIGVAAQETDVGNPYGDTYIASTHVKYLQQAGARVVPVRAGEPDHYYIDLFSKLNGMLFPGGRVDMVNSLLARTARIIYNLTLQAADRGDVFPLWGTCNGFQLFPTITAGERLRHWTKTRNLVMPLDVESGYRDSRMLGEVPEDLMTYMRTAPFAQHHHKWSIAMHKFQNHSKLKNFYKVLSSNVGRRGQRFASTFEAYNYPIYGTQWHPEKNAFFWNPSFVINHSKRAVKAAEYFARFFVNEARKSSHRFPSAEEEAAALIDNFTPVFVPDGKFYEKYFFDFRPDCCFCTRHIPD